MQEHYDRAWERHRSPEAPDPIYEEVKKNTAEEGSVELNPEVLEEANQRAFNRACMPSIRVRNAYID